MPGDFELVAGGGIWPLKMASLLTGGLCPVGRKISALVCYRFK